MVSGGIEGVINGKKVIKTGKVTVYKIPEVNDKGKILLIEMLHTLTELFLGSRIFSLSSIRGLAVLAISNRPKGKFIPAFFRPCRWREKRNQKRGEPNNPWICGMGARRHRKKINPLHEWCDQYAR
jgi:hypothetical protein